MPDQRLTISLIAAGVLILVSIGYALSGLPHTPRPPKLQCGPFHYDNGCVISVPERR